MTCHNVLCERCVSWCSVVLFSFCQALCFLFSPCGCKIANFVFSRSRVATAAFGIYHKNFNILSHFSFFLLCQLHLWSYVLFFVIFSEPSLLFFSRFLLLNLLVSCIMNNPSAFAPISDQPAVTDRRPNESSYLVLYPNLSVCFMGVCALDLCRERLIKN